MGKSKRIKTKGRKFKSRRPFNRAEAFPKQEIQHMDFLMMKLRESFPDPTMRLKYIESLIEGLKTDTVVEN